MSQGVGGHWARGPFSGRLAAASHLFFLASRFGEGEAVLPDIEHLQLAGKDLLDELERLDVLLRNRSLEEHLEHAHRALRRGPDHRTLLGLCKPIACILFEHARALVVRRHKIGEPLEHLQLPLALGRVPQLEPPPLDALGEDVERLLLLNLRVVRLRERVELLLDLKVFVRLPRVLYETAADAHVVGVGAVGVVKVGKDVAGGATAAAGL